MMNTTKRLTLWVATVAACLLTFGCERAETDRGLDVTPENARIAWEGSVTFSVALPESAGRDREIYYPLEWTVSHPDMGTLQESQGSTAVYIAARRSGVNSILVQDQSGAQGIVAVEQFSPASGQGN